MPLDIEEEQQDLGKADGLKKYQEFLPFAKTNIDDFKNLLKELRTDGEDLTVDNIKGQFYQITDWQHAFELKSDINLEQFLESPIFALDGGKQDKILDQERLTLFGYFSC